MIGKVRKPKRPELQISDGQLKIQGRGACLNQILSTNGDFVDKPFVELLVESEEEHSRFHDFIATSAKTCAAPDMQSGMPPCLRVSLQSKSSTRVGVDLFHVSLSNLYGSGDSYHLLALRQDPEPQPVPDAQGLDVSRQLIRQTLAQQHRLAPTAPSSDSGTSACALFQTPKLTAMMLLIDAATRHQDVCQVHLNYEEISEREGAMPSLRSFIRPTDWGGIRSRVKQYGQKALANSSLEPKVFSKPIWFRMLDDPRRYMLANTAKMSLRSSGSEAPKIWLYLTDLASPERRAASVELAGIQEMQD